MNLELLFILLILSIVILFVFFLIYKNRNDLDERSGEEKVGEAAQESPTDKTTKYYKFDGYKEPESENELLEECQEATPEISPPQYDPDKSIAQKKTNTEGKEKIKVEIDRKVKIQYTSPMELREQYYLWVLFLKKGTYSHNEIELKEQEEEINFTSEDKEPLITVIPRSPYFNFSPSELKIIINDEDEIENYFKVRPINLPRNPEVEIAFDFFYKGKRLKKDPVKIIVIIHAKVAGISSKFGGYITAISASMAFLQATIQSLTSTFKFMGQFQNYNSFMSISAIIFIISIFFFVLGIYLLIIRGKTKDKSAKISENIIISS
ncbi:hypothetical protein [uncultured Methanobacterium sp.]|uniref:hypothetical protein n=1 Tax=uncultured Methanobacterium sp. TaxID=176306 RepID=UPI002AA77DEB|nr:hypothetical protein [uncultured Methanobacterium sp.]